MGEGKRSGRVAILGGCGAIGEHTLRRLAKDKAIAEIVLADLNMVRARELAEELGAGKVLPRPVDVKDKQSIAEAIKDSDLVINETGPFFEYGIEAARAAVEVGVNYVDIGDDGDATAQLLESEELDKRAKEAGIFVLPGLGTSPGITNLLAKYGADKLDRVDTIKVSLASSVRRSGPAAIGHRLHMFQGQVTIFRDGRWVQVPAGSEAEVVAFPEMANGVEVYIIGHPEPITIPRFIKGVKEVTLKMGYIPPSYNDLLRNLAGLGLTSTELMSIDGAPVSPMGFISTYLASERAYRLLGLDRVQPYMGRQVQVAGEKGGQQASYTYLFWSSGPSAAITSAAITGMPPALVASLLLDDKLSISGIVAPEMLDPTPFLRELDSMGVPCYESKEEIARIHHS